MRLVRKYGRSGPRMFEQVWDLLRMYTFVVNVELKKRGLPRKGQLEIMGAICSHFLLAMRNRILQEYDVAHTTYALDECRTTIAAALDATTAANFPVLAEPGGAGPTGLDAALNVAEADRAIRGTIAGSDPATVRLSAIPGEVRTRRARAAGVLDAREQIRRAIEHD